MADQPLPHLSDEIREFIRKKASENPADVALELSGQTDWPRKFITQQIKGRQIAKKKIPSWSEIDEILFPPHLNLEQSSSEITARHKATLFSGDLLVDLTGGFGVDALFMAASFKQVKIIEPNPELVQLVRHNAEVLGLEHVSVYQSTAEGFLADFDGKADCMVIDPSRRDEYQRRMNRLEDGVPNVIQLKKELLEKSKYTLIKASPMLDITQAYRDLSSVCDIQVISVKNECKEILFTLSDEKTENSDSDCTIEAVELAGKESNRILEKADFPYSFFSLRISEPGAYLYDPNVSLLKAGLQDIHAGRLKLNKLDQNTHLYDSEELNEDFCGRIFRILERSPLNRKKLKWLKQEKQFNIICKNVPLSPNQVRKKLKISEGGKMFMIVAKTLNGVEVMVCERVK